MKTAFRFMKWTMSGALVGGLAGYWFGRWSTGFDDYADAAIPFPLAEFAFAFFGLVIGGTSGIVVAAARFLIQDLRGGTRAGQ
jgi:ABC-type dipeptide/oligopeptide/nickel transport system permease subunit